MANIQIVAGSTLSCFAATGSVTMWRLTNNFIFKKFMCINENTHWIKAALLATDGTLAFLLVNPGWVY